jgi:hypothetical protein
VKEAPSEPQNDRTVATKQDEPPPGPSVEPQTATIGPSLPTAGDLNDTLLEDTNTAMDPDNAPPSPYSATRSLIQELTLPSIPDFDIPPSPPGSPPAAIDKKFSQFLDLKKKGIHFNQKLEQSAALKNPNVMDKLMRFVELEGVQQYETTLPKELWDPTGFPEWAHREGLRQSREQLIKERESQNASGNRKAPEFVPASNARKAG